MGVCISRVFKREIISERSLYAVQDLIYYLKRNLRHMDVFHVTGNNLMVHQIVGELTRGSRNLRNILEQGWTLESASALQQFLIRLRAPLIPVHIQALALDDNTGIQAEIVAQDILGLLKQDVIGRQSFLITNILDLLNCVLKHAPNDELLGCNIPISMLPVFFQLQSQHIAKWRRVAMIFVEMIRLAPAYFLIDVEDDDLNERLMANPDRPVNQHHLEMEQRLMDMNSAMRHYNSRTVPDASFVETATADTNRRIKNRRHRPYVVYNSSSSSTVSEQPHNYHKRK